MKSISKYIQFLIGGSVGVLVDYVAYFVLVHFFGLFYIISAVIGFLLNTGVNFLTQKFWIFKNTETDKTYRQAWFFLVLNTMLFTANLGILFVLVHYFKFHYMWAKAELSVFSSFFNFWMTKLIFAKPTP